MQKLKVGIVSLGCDKNRIDTEIALGELSKKFEIINEPKAADIIIVNTCGFIESAKQESIDSILEMSKYKKKYNCKILVATGCLTQRYGKELLELMPEIDIMLGVNSYENLLQKIDDFIRENEKIIDLTYSDTGVNSGGRILTTGSSTAYVRISEGCNNNCTYCIIPKIRGRYRSRKIEDIIVEAEKLAASGVKELILVAQDTTRYGTDIYGEKKLHILLKRLSEISGIEWIRILYCYVEEIYDELIYEMASNSKVCKYIDMPIQHISNDILIKMHRRGRKEQIIDTINNIRKIMPNVVLRTSLIVGFPGETEDDFNELKEFVRDIKFDKLGVFRYSQEEDTLAASMPHQISEEAKMQRENELMLIQQQVSKCINMDKIGKCYDVLIEGYSEGIYTGRSFEMSPEIDGVIFFKCDKILNVGDLTKVTIIQAKEYDLIGVV